MGNVLNEISIERMRQADREGYSDEHDDAHDGGELAAAASCYAMNAACLLHPANGTSMELESVTMMGWPWEASAWKPKDARRDLVRAAALIVAEIERMDRVAHRDAAGNTP